MSASNDKGDQMGIARRICFWILALTLLSGCLGSAPVLELPHIAMADFLASDTLVLSVSQMESKTIQGGVWTCAYDLQTKQCTTLFRADAGSRTYVGSGSDLKTLYWDVQDWPLRGDISTLACLASTRSVSWLNLQWKEPLPRALSQEGIGIYGPTSTIPLRIFSSSNMLLCRRDYYVINPEGSNRITGAEYLLWDLCRAKAVDTSPCGVDVFNRPDSVSPPFGESREAFLMVEREFVGEEYVRRIVLFQLNPLRRLADRTVPWGYIELTQDTARPHELVALLGSHEEDRLTYARISLAASGQDFDIIAFDTLESEEGQCKVLWRGGMEFCSRSDTNSVLIDKSPPLSGQKAVSIVVRDPRRFAVSNDGTCLVSWADDDALEVWQIDFPQVQRLADLRVAWASDSRLPYLVDVNKPGEAPGQADGM